MREPLATTTSDPPFDIDVFISYAHDDDNVVIEDNIGWVTQFHKVFEQILYEQLGRRPIIWRDSDITPNEDFEKKIFNRLVRSAVFLPVVSKIFVKRAYCLRELREFVQNAELALDTYVDGEKKRIFIVEKIPVAREIMPEELRGFGGTYKFYKDGEQTLRPVKSSKESQDYDKYITVVNRLSVEVARLIELMMQFRLRDPKAPAPAPRMAVYMAEPTSDLRDQADALRDDLTDRGYLVLPEFDLPRHVAEYKKAVQSALDRSVLSVHLIGREYGFIPEGEKELSHVRLQHQLAIERHEREPTFSQVIWLASQENGTDDERQVLFLTYLQEDDRTNRSADILKGGLEALKTEIYAKLKQQEQRAEQPKVSAAPAGTKAVPEGSEAALVYIICEGRDRDDPLLKVLEDCLFEAGCEPKLPTIGVDEADTLEAHLEKLQEFDAFIVYHGAGTDRWLEARLSELRKHLRGRERPALARAVFLAPPLTPTKLAFRTREALLMRPAPAFAAEIIAPFLAALRRTDGS